MSSYKRPLPLQRDPPCIQTMTALRPPSSGVYTFKYKLSSDIGNSSRGTGLNPIAVFALSCGPDGAWKRGFGFRLIVYSHQSHSTCKKRECVKSCTRTVFTVVIPVWHNSFISSFIHSVIFCCLSFFLSFLFFFLIAFYFLFFTCFLSFFNY